MAHTLLLAVLCNLALELVQLTGTDGYPWRFKSPAFPGMFVLGSLVVWLLVGLVHAVVGRLWVTTALMATATAVVAVADHEKVRLLREPVYPSDWEFVGNLSFLSDIVGPRVVVLLVVAVLVMALAAVPAARVRSAGGSRPAPRHPAAGPAADPDAGPRARPAALCLLGIGYLGGFNTPGNAVRGDVRRPRRRRGGPGASSATTSATASSAASSTTSRPGDAPAGRLQRGRRWPGSPRGTPPRPTGSTGTATPRALARRQRGDGAQRVVQRPHRARRACTSTEDPIPFTRRLMASTTSGAMLAQNIGGGTANMEFEALTGMSMSQLPPQLRVPYQSLVPRFATFPSAVEWLKREGHRAIAIHPFTTEMYRRRDVYRDPRVRRSSCTTTPCTSRPPAATTATSPTRRRSTRSAAASTTPPIRCSCTW